MAKKPAVQKSNSAKKSEEKMRRERLLRFLESSKPVWTEADHPELEDSAAWVRNLRGGNERRIPKKSTSRS
jgi:hypothetical protein